MARQKTFEKHYPDLAAQGSLRELLVHLSQQLGVELPMDAASARVESRHRFSQVSVALNQRLFMLDLWQNGVVLATGQTKKPEQVVSLLHKYVVEEASVTDLSREFSWLKLTEDAEFYLAGARAFVEWQWETMGDLLQDDPHMKIIYPVFEAARQHPRLGQLFPFTSMWSLCFSSCTGYPFDTPCPDIQPVRDDKLPQRYTVGDWNMDRENVMFEGDTEAVVAFVGAQLPPDCGPARHGTAEDE